jgi:hypothetical protein
VPISGMNCSILVLHAARKRIGGIKIVINRWIGSYTLTSFILYLQASSLWYVCPLSSFSLSSHHIKQYISVCKFIKHVAAQPPFSSCFSASRLVDTSHDETKSRQPLWIAQKVKILADNNWLWLFFKIGKLC